MNVCIRLNLITLADQLQLQFNECTYGTRSFDVHLEVTQCIRKNCLILGFSRHVTPIYRVFGSTKEHEKLEGRWQAAIMIALLPQLKVTRKQWKYPKINLVGSIRPMDQGIESETTAIFSSNPDPSSLISINEITRSRTL